MKKALDHIGQELWNAFDTTELCSAYAPPEAHGKLIVCDVIFRPPVESVIMVPQLL